MFPEFGKKADALLSDLSHMDILPGCLVG